MAPGMQGTFDPTQLGPPRQLSGDSHSIGKKFPFQISNTEIKATKDNDGGMLVVEFTTPAGIINFRYNLWNKSEKAVEIARSQLNLLCHVTGIYKGIQYDNDCAIFRGARGMIDVDYQKGHEPTAEKPEGGYTEIKRMYDANGNEPGKPASAPQPMQGQQSSNPAAPQQWNAPQTPQGGAPANNPAPGAWQPGPNVNPAPAPNPGPGGWTQQPQGNAPANVPWGPK